MSEALYQSLVNRLGGFPTRVEPTSTLLERVDCGTYTREKIVLVCGTRTIPMYLLLPHVEGPRPAVLAHHQHAGEYHLGKSEPAGITGNPQMFYAHRLAMEGYVVAAWDAVGFEERYNALFSARHEHYLATRALVMGTCLEQEYMLDAFHVADYLAVRTEVDMEAGLGCIGHSLGGQNVLFNLLLDERVKVGVASCGIGTVQSFIEEQVTHNLAWYVPGLLQLGDTVGLTALLKGKRLFISQGTADSLFPMRGVMAFAESASQYAEVETCFFNGPHTFPDEAFTKAVAFLDDFFKSSTTVGGGKR